MTTFTRLLLVLTVVGLGFNATAQIYDIGAAYVAVASTGSDEVFPRYQTPAVYGIENTGGDTIMADFRYSRTLLVDGTPVVGPDTFIFGEMILVGDTFETVIGGYLHQFGNAAGTEDICIVVALVDSVETSLLNNLECTEYTINPDITNDWAVDTVEIANWVALDSHVVLDGVPAPEIDSLDITFTCNSTLPYWAGSDFNITLYSGTNDSIEWSGSIGADIFPGTQFTITYYPNLGIPDVKQTKGFHDFCVRIRQTNDTTDTNDIACTTYEIAVPEAIGIGEYGADDPISVYNAYNFIHVEGFEGTAQVQIMDATGKIMASTVIRENDRIPLAEFSSGMYIVNVATQDARVQTERIMKY